MPTDEAKPRFEHDCSTCTYLGRYDVPDGPFAGEYDLYHCPQSGMPTVIARFGDDGPEYYSGIGFKALTPLVEAQERARQRDLPLTQSRRTHAEH